MKPEIKIKEKRHRFTLRIPELLLKKIDEIRSKSPVGPISKNQWILAQIAKGIEEK